MTANIRLFDKPQVIKMSKSEDGIIRSKEYAIGSAEESWKRFADSNQRKKENIQKQHETGKIGEYAVYVIFTVQGISVQ